MNSNHFCRMPEFGATVACDGKCTKACGLNCRPRRVLDSNDPEDYVWFADDELKFVPENRRKPVDPSQMNEWCVHCCERAELFPLDCDRRRMETIDFSKRVYNLPWKHQEQSIDLAARKSEKEKLKRLYAFVSEGQAPPTKDELQAVEEAWKPSDPAIKTSGENE